MKLNQMISLGLEKRYANALDMHNKGKTYTYIGEQYLKVSKRNAKRICLMAEQRLDWLVACLTLRPRTRNLINKLGFKSKLDVDYEMDAWDWAPSGHKIPGVGPKMREEINEWLRDDFSLKDISTAPEEGTFDLLHIENYIVKGCTRGDIPVRGGGWQEANDTDTWQPDGTFTHWLDRS